MDNKKLSFIIIGAQKAGTTALHKYLSENEELYLPPEKEAIFFSDDSRYEKGFDWYLKEFFNSASDNKKIGKATPAYSCYPVQAAERIIEHNPDVKIIYLLRDPIDRAISQYNMNKKRNLVFEPAGEVFERLMSIEELDDSRKHGNEVNSYIVWGEYVRVLGSYAGVKPGNMLIMNDSFLKDSTIEAVSVVSDFIGVSFQYGKNINEKFHVGGVRRYSIIDRIKNNNFLKNIWRKIIPFKFRRRFGFWLDQWNTKNVDFGESTDLGDCLKKKMTEHYSGEYELINKVTLCGGYLFV